MTRPTAEDWAGLLRHLPVLSKKRYTAGASPSPQPTSPAVTTAASGPPSAKDYTNVAAALFLLLGAGVVGNWLEGRFHPPAKPLPVQFTDSPWRAEMLSPSSSTSRVDISPVLDRFRRENAQRKQPELRFVDRPRSYSPHKETIP